MTCLENWLNTGVNVSPYSLYSERNSENTKRFSSEIEFLVQRTIKEPLHKQKRSYQRHGPTKDTYDLITNVSCAYFQVIFEPLNKLSI